jgi:hypothetical protein
MVEIELDDGGTNQVTVDQIDGYHTTQNPRRRQPERGKAELTFGEAMLRVRDSILTATRQIAASLPDLLGLVEQWETDSEEVLRLISAQGWLVSRRMMPRFTSEMLATYRLGGMDALEAKLLLEYDGVFCANLVRDLRSDLFAEWRPVLRKALRAHVHGDYELAIPIWLITAEAVIAGWQSDAHVYRRLKPALMKGWLTDALGTKGLLHTLLVESLVDVLSGQRAHWVRGVDPSVLNRHGVLHGGIPAIGDRKDSVQGLLVLETLDWLIPSPAKT